MKPSFSVFAVGCLFALLFSSSLAWASAVMPVNAAELSEKSSVVFSGKCLSSRVETKGGMKVMTNTFEVSDLVKGDVKGSTFSFQQAIFMGSPRYLEGKEYMLFLAGPNRKNLWMPVGIGQGVFVIEDGKAVNGYNNKRLFSGMPQTAQTTKAMKAGGFSENALQGPVDVNSLKTMVREMGHSRQPAK